MSDEKKIYFVGWTWVDEGEEFYGTHLLSEDEVRQAEKHIVGMAEKNEIKDWGIYEMEEGLPGLKDLLQACERESPAKMRERLPEYFLNET